MIDQYLLNQEFLKHQMGCTSTHPFPAWLDHVVGIQCIVSRIALAVMHDDTSALSSNGNQDDFDLANSLILTSSLLVLAIIGYFINTHRLTTSLENQTEGPDLDGSGGDGKTEGVNGGGWWGGVGEGWTERARIKAVESKETPFVSNVCYTDIHREEFKSGRSVGRRFLLTFCMGIWDVEVEKVNCFRGFLVFGF